MDHETLLRSKRSSKWTSVGNEPILSAERDPSMTVADCHAKDELLKKYEKIARVAQEGQSKAEERELLIKQELNEAVAAKVAADERLSLVEAALAYSVEQLNALEDEMEGKIRDAVVKGTTMFVERQIEFEEKLNEATADFVNLSVENSRLVAEISAKDEAIEDLDRRRCMAESELDVLVMRLDGIMKENAFLRYEFQLMEKELAVCNEQLKFCDQSAEGLHKKHLQSLKKVAKLEAECQRLRIQLQKRVMQSAMTRMPNSRKSHVTERLRTLEDENKMLKEVILMKDSKLEKACDEGSGDGHYLKVPRYEFDFCKECSSSESWANALILELENFQKEGLQSTLSHGSELSLKPSPETDFLGAEKSVLVPLEIAPSSKDKSSSSLTKSVDWLQVVLDAITEQRRISKRDFEDLLLDVWIALGFSDSCKNPRQMRQYGASRKYDVASLLPCQLTTKMGSGDEIETTEMVKTELEERLENAQQEIYRMNDDAVRLKESKRLLEDQIEHQKLVNRDLETQLAVTRVEINEVMQQYYSLEVELEDQNHRCEELESTCIELELQLGSVATEPSDYDGMIHGPTLSQDGREEKFVACKDTIPGITKQPKTPPSPSKASAGPSKASASSRASSDRSTAMASRGSNNRPSLHDRMLADGFAELKVVSVPHSTEIPNRRSGDALFISGADIRTLEMIQKNAAKTAAGPPATATSPRKRNGSAGFGFVRKLMIKSNRDRQGGLVDA